MYKRKVLAVLIAFALVLTTITPAFASVTQYLAQAENGTVYVYDYQALKDSYTNKVLGLEDTALYDHYAANKVVAVYDDQTDRYVDFEQMQQDYVDAVLTGEGESFDMDEYAAGQSAQLAAMPNTVAIVSINDTGEIVIEEENLGPAEVIKVESVSAINNTTITVKFSNGVTQNFTVAPMQVGNNTININFNGRDYTVTAAYAAEYALAIETQGDLVADGKSVMKIIATVTATDGSAFQGDARFSSKLGLKAAQSEAAFDKGQAVFNVTLPNSEVDLNDVITIEIINSESIEANGTLAAKDVTYQAYKPGGGQSGTIQYVAVDSVKSTDLADRVFVYVGGVTEDKKADIKTAIKNQVKIYKDADFTKAPIDIVDIVKDEISGTGYVFTALLDLPSYGTPSTAYNVMTDNQYNFYEVKDGVANIRLTKVQPNAEATKFMLIDRTKPSVQDVKSPKVNTEGLLDEMWLPANTLLVQYSEAVNRATAETFSNYVLNGHVLAAADVNYVRTLDIASEEDIDGKALVALNAVVKGLGKERNAVIINLKNTAAKNFLIEGQNLLQIRSVSDWAGVTDLSDNNKIVTQDFLFNYTRPLADTAIGIIKESPEQFVVDTKGMYKDADAANKVDLATATKNIAYKVELLDKTNRALIKDVTANTRVVKLPAPETTLVVDKWIFELDTDWTKLLAEPTAYHNHYYRVTITDETYDIYGDKVAVGKKNAEVALPEDTKSPAVAVIDGVKAVVFNHAIKKGYVKITMDEPVQIFKTGDNYIAPAITSSLEQDKGTGVPVPTFEYVKLSEKQPGDLYSAGTKIAGELTGAIANEHDMTFFAQPTKDLEVGDWKLVVRQISDDVGNTMATEEFPFTITGVIVTNNVVNPYITWAYADDDKVNLDGTMNDYVYILYSRQMSVEALRAATYDINGKQVNQDADITKEDLVLYRYSSNPASPEYNNFFGDRLDANGAELAADKLASDMMQWRGQLVTIKLPADFIIGGDDLDGDRDGLFRKNVLTVPNGAATLKAIDDGVEATADVLLFDNNGDSNQYELTFDKGKFGLNGIPAGIANKVPAISYAANGTYATANAHHTGSSPLEPLEPVVDAKTADGEVQLTTIGSTTIARVYVNSAEVGTQFSVNNGPKAAYGTTECAQFAVTTGMTKATVDLFNAAGQKVGIFDVDVTKAGAFADKEITEIAVPVSKASGEVKLTTIGATNIARVYIHSADLGTQFSVNDGSKKAYGTTEYAQFTVPTGMTTVDVDLFDATDAKVGTVTVDVTAGATFTDQTIK